MLNYQPFVRFVVERHQTSLNKEAGLPWPWTQNRILQTYRFCNVYRERDRVTLWIRRNWRFAGNPDAWFAMVVARLVNWPDTLQHLKPLPWSPLHFLDVMDSRLAAKQQAFGPAYIVSTNGRSMPKPLYLQRHVLDPLWAGKERFRPVQGERLWSFHAKLTSAQGLGSFMAAQVVADVKNMPGPLAKAPDWMTWAAPGPGSLRGLNRILGNGAVRTGLPLARFQDCVNELRAAVNAEFINRAWTPICAQDLQNCLCEFDKYERVRLGQGKPKQLYSGPWM